MRRLALASRARFAVIFARCLFAATSARLLLAATFARCLLAAILARLLFAAILALDKFVARPRSLNARPPTLLIAAAAGRPWFTEANWARLLRAKSWCERCAAVIPI